MQRPLLVVYDLFEDSVQDLSWSTTRHILLACSRDGTVACIMFSDEELGVSISTEDKVYICCSLPQFCFEIINSCYFTLCVLSIRRMLCISEFMVKVQTSI